MGSSSPDGRGRFRDRLLQDVNAVVRELREGRETPERGVARLVFLAEAYAAQRVALAPAGRAGPAEPAGDRRVVERAIPIARTVDGSTALREPRPAEERSVARARARVCRRVLAPAGRGVDLA